VRQRHNNRIGQLGKEKRILLDGIGFDFKLEEEAQTQQQPAQSQLQQQTSPPQPQPILPERSTRKYVQPAKDDSASLTEEATDDEEYVREDEEEQEQDSPKKRKYTRVANSGKNGNKALVEEDDEAYRPRGRKNKWATTAADRSSRKVKRDNSMDEEYSFQGSKSYLGSAAVVLQNAGRPMSVNEIITKAISDGITTISDNTN
jgi:hypothetical protein